MLTYSQVEYTIGRVVATLTMVESPTGVLFEPLSSDDSNATVELDGKDGKTTTEPDLLMIKQQPITAKLRTAVKHLHARAGFWSRFRGFSIYLVHGFLVSNGTAFVASSVVPRPIAAILISVVFARLRMGWTHIVMTEPSAKPWFRRLPSIKLWKKIALPTALLAICEQATVGIPVAFFYAMNLDKMDNEVINNMTCAERKMLAIKVVSILFLCIFAAVAIVIPANVTLTRVQASLVSDDDETIVPFDRSFGGKVVPEIVGGSGVISMLDAWKTFDWNSRIRLIKLYVKVGVMQILLTSLFVVAITSQIRLIVGSDGLEKGTAYMTAAFTRKG